MKRTNLTVFFITTIIYIVFIYASIFILNKQVDSPMHVSLDGLDGYVKEGFAAYELLMPDLSDESWTVLDGANGRDVSGFMEKYKKPMFTFHDDKPIDFTYIIEFDMSLQSITYMRRNSIMPALFIAGMSDNWEIYLNGNLIAREIHLDENGFITQHQDRQMFSIPFDASFLNEKDNILVFRIVSSPNYSWIGPYRASGNYIEDYEVIQKEANGYLLILLVGIYFFMFFYNIMIFLRNNKERLYLWYALFSLLLGLYTMANTPLIYLLFSNTFYALTLEFASLMLVGIPLALFTNAIIGGKIHKIMYVLFAIMIAVVASMPFGGMQYIDNVLPVGEVGCLAFVLYGFIRLLIYLAAQISQRMKEENESLFRAAANIITGTLVGNVAMGFSIAIAGMLFGFYCSMIAKVDPQNILVLLFAVVLSMAFALNDDVTKTKLLVAEQNTRLEEKVELRTEELARQVAVANAANNAKSKFLATMSHEIRTPMNAIIGVSEILLLRTDITADIAEAIGQIHGSGHSLLGIINDILDLSKIETGKLELNPLAYDVPSLIHDTIQMNMIRIGGKPIKFILDIEDDLPSRLYGDELRLKQILNNILSNAFKYTDEGQVQLTIRHRFEQNKAILIFKVADTGQGMKAEDLERLFSEYTRFNDSANYMTEGTGLGMSITKKLAIMMGGKIEVESEYGKGSTFTVTVSQERIDERTIGRALAESLCDFTFTGERQNASLQITRAYMPYGKVLIVDDVETNLYVAKGTMAPYGLMIETADSGYEALERIENGEVYDIIFLDHMMPGMDGIETARRIREFGYQGTIIALTANAIAGNDVMFMKNGFDGFISKPIDLRQLNSALNRFVRDKHKKKAGGLPEVPGHEARIIVHPKLLEIFRRDAAKSILALQQAMKENDIKLFTTTVHAMKSAFANVGKMEQAKLAAKLEEAGRKGDTAFIDENVNCFIEILNEQAAKEADKEENAGGMEDKALLVEQLRKIISACENYDDSAADKAFEALQSKQWTRDTADVLNKMKDELFLHSDFDAVATLANQYLARQ